MDNNMTPVVNPTPKFIDFPEAIRKINEGKRVARVSWQNADYGVLKDGWLTIFHKKDNKPIATFHIWNVSDGDMNGDDWIVLPDLE
jgi:hypothetical protein